MSNQITPLIDSDMIPPNLIFFVKVNYFYVPFLNPSRDTVLAARGQDSETVLDIIDVQFDANNNALCKCQIRPIVDYLTVSNADQFVMNIFQYISANITRLFGIQISQTFFTSDDNFPDSGSTMVPSLGSGTRVNPSSTDAQQQVVTTAQDTAKAIKDALVNAKATVKNSSMILIIILIVVVIGIFGFAYAEKEAA